MYVDENGNDAIYVSLYTWNDGGLPIVGHAMLYYQDKLGNWRLTEYTGKKPKKAIVYDDFAFDSTKELLNFLVGLNCDYKYLEGDFSKIEDYADVNKGFNYEGYKLFKNNCLHYVKNALKYSDVNLYMNDTIIPKNFNPFVIKIGCGGGLSLINNQHNESSLGGIATLYCYEKTNSFNYLMRIF